MASLVLDDCQIFLNDLDLTGMTNQAELSASADELDVSTFGSAGWREHIQGAQNYEFTLGGPWGFTDPDDETWTHLTTTQTDPILSIATTSDAGAVAYAMVPQGFNRDVGGSYGGVPTWNLTGRSRQHADGLYDGLFRGITSIAKQTVTGNVTGSALNIASYGSTDLVSVFVHVFADNGTSVDVILERDDNADFTSATTVATVSVAGVGQDVNGSAGFLLGSDTYFRARTANLSGTSFELAAIVAHRITS